MLHGGFSGAQVWISSKFINYIEKEMKRGILLNIVLLCIFNTVIFAQSNFNNFLESFKEYKWEELIGPSEYLTTQDTINYEYANKNMWHEHRTIRRETKGLSYATSALHIRIKGGQYAMYHHGFHGLYDNGIKMSDGFVKYNLYTIGKVYLSDSIVLLILKYNYYDPEDMVLQLKHSHLG